MADDPKSLTREELYDLVWSEPMLKLAGRFGVSSSYLARVCTLLSVPRPERGYWAKLAVGKARGKPSLPAALPGDDTAWTVGVMPRVADAAPQEGGTLTRLREARAKFPSRPVHAVSATHSLVRGVRDLFASGKLSYDIEYLKPQKRLLPDIIVSLGCLDRALSFASQLYKSLDSAGYRTVIAAHGEACSRAEVVLHEGKNGNSHLGLWSPGRCTVVYVNETPIGLTIFEATEKVSMRYVGGRYVRESEYKPPKHSRHSADNTWTTTKDCPSGRLCLQAYSPFDGKTWLQWRSERNLDLATRIPEIVRAMPRGAAEIKERHDAAMREREEMFRRWDEDERQRKEAEAKRKAAAAAQASRDELRAFVAEWDEQRRLTAFFEQAEQRIRMLDVHKQAALLERARLAKALIGDSDPLFRLLEWQTPEERLRR